jgi:hypothetical protein
MGHSLKLLKIKNGDVLWIHGFMPLNCSDFARFLLPPTHPLMKPSGWMGHSLEAGEIRTPSPAAHPSAHEAERMDEAQPEAAKKNKPGSREKNRPGSREMKTPANGSRALFLLLFIG